MPPGESRPSIAPIPIRWGIAAVWLANGLLAKVLGLVPRHEEIVARILGETQASRFTLAIGLGEIFMALWVLGGRRARVCAGVQIVLVLVMNLIEQVLAADLLLWGRWNLVFALTFAGVVYWVAFRARALEIDRSMLSFLKRHPFAVEAFFERSVVLGYALPPERLESLIPAALTLDTLDDRWAFLAVAMVRTRDLRPAGWPRLLGRDFSLIGYRVFVRYRTSDGRDLRGLYILRSETDRLGMKLSGNLFTRYDYRTTDLAWEVEGDEIGIRSRRSALDVRVAQASGEPELPDGSPFADWREARRFAGPMPYTFSLDERRNEMVIIKGVRSNWQPSPLVVRQAHVGFLADRGLEDARLANAFVVSDIPYLWEKGRIDPVSGGAGR